MEPNLNSLFRAYDIRGVYGKDFDDQFARDFGRSFVTWLSRSKKAARPELFVGQDVRPSSPPLTRSLIQGLMESGARVTDAGMVPTPVLYYLVWRYHKTGGVEVTASHNPAEYNGLKPAWNGIVLSKEEQQQVRKILEKRSFKSGKGSLRKRKFEGEFLRHATKGLKPGRPLKVVVDSGNGACGPLALKMLEKLGCKAIPLHCDPIPGFPNHQPDPLKAENVADLRKKVVSTHADLGIGFDGDGDRVAFIDEKGGALSSDESLVLFMRDLAGGSRFRKPYRVYYNILMSNAVPEEARKLGAKPVLMPVGHTYLQGAMFGRNSLVAGEASGHFFFKANGGYDDAFHAAARFIHYVASQNSPVSEIRRSIPRYYATPASYINCPDEKKFKVVESIKHSLGKSYNTITIDGVRVELMRSWGLLRPSNTNPQLSFRFEGETLEDLRAVYSLFNRELIKYKLSLPKLETIVVPPLQ